MRLNHLNLSLYMLLSRHFGRWNSQRVGASQKNDSKETVVPLKMAAEVNALCSAG